MKKLIIGVFAMSAALSQAALASNNLMQDLMFRSSQMQIMAEMRTNNVINWKVGENTAYTLDTSFGFPMGTMTKAATKEEGNAIWISSLIDAQGQKQTQEILLDRADAHIIKYIENGQEKPVPASNLEIIDQEATSITVPAGTFDVIHVTAKSDNKKVQIWANPSAIPLDGSAQMQMETGMGFDIIPKLTKFGGK